MDSQYSKDQSEYSSQSYSQSSSDDSSVSSSDSVSYQRYLSSTPGEVQDYMDVVDDSSDSDSDSE